MLKKLKLELYGVRLFLSKMTLREKTFIEFLFPVLLLTAKTNFQNLYESQIVIWFHINGQIKKEADTNHEMVNVENQS